MMSELLRQLSQEMAIAVADVKQGLVAIRNGRRRGNGAGIIWESNGLIVTNAHVIQRENPKVELGRQGSARGKVMAHDRNLDLALIQVPLNGLTPIPRGESRALRPGDWVTAVGHPWGVHGAVTSGMVIGMDSEWEEMPRRRGRELIFVGLHLRPGHSGGPLIDHAGRLVGVNTMATGPDVGVAVPVHVAEQFVEAHIRGQ
jgi:S1-C subfamily serine protease